MTHTKQLYKPITSMEHKKNALYCMISFQNIYRNIV